MVGHEPRAPPDIAITSELANSIRLDEYPAVTLEVARVCRARGVGHGVVDVGVHGGPIATRCATSHVAAPDEFIERRAWPVLGLRFQLGCRHPPEFGSAGDHSANSDAGTMPPPKINAAFLHPGSAPLAATWRSSTGGAATSTSPGATGSWRSSTIGSAAGPSPWSSTSEAACSAALSATTWTTMLLARPSSPTAGHSGRPHWHDS